MFIKSIEQIRKEKDSKVFKDSVKGTMFHIHGAVTANDPHADIIFHINLPSDWGIMEKVNHQFINKGYRIQELSRQTKPRNVKFNDEEHFREYTEVINRFYLN